MKGITFQPSFEAMLKIAGSHCSRCESPNATIVFDALVSPRTQIFAVVWPSVASQPGGTA
jgi:hypothetical protein